MHPGYGLLQKKVKQKKWSSTTCIVWIEEFLSNY